MLINTLPEYSPGENLPLFISKVDRLIQITSSLSQSPLQNYIILQGIHSKIRGEAANFISYFNCETWDTTKQVLLSKYGDQRSEQVLLNELDSLSQRQ